MTKLWGKFFRVPTLTRPRIIAAFSVAIITDALQLLLGPFGWFVIDEVLDVMAMILTSWLLGFHPLLLPTFLLELVPLADYLPVWTGCVAWVVSNRKTNQVKANPAPQTDNAEVIDVEARRIK